MSDDRPHVIHVSHESHSPPPPPPPTIPGYPMEFPPSAETHHTHHQHHTYQDYGYPSQPFVNPPLPSDPHHKPATQGNYWIFFAFVALFLLIWYLSEN